MHRSADGRQCLYLATTDIVGDKLRSELLGEPTGQQHRVHAVRQRITERVEFDHFSASGPQQYGVLWVSETECLSHCHGGTPAGCCAHCCCRVPGPIRSPAPGSGKQSDQIDMAGDQDRHCLDRDVRTTLVLYGSSKI